MKKLLGLLAVAPLAITACGDKTSSSSDGGSNTDVQVENLFSEGVVSASLVNSWFTDGHEKNLKTQLAAATARGEADVMSPVVANSFLKKSQKSYSFTAPGRSAFTGDLSASVTEFKAGLATINAANSLSTPSSIQAPWNTVLKSGQVLRNRNSNNTVSDSNIDVMPTSTNVNTVIDMPNISPIISGVGTALGSESFTQNDVAITFSNGAALNGTGVIATPQLANVSLGKYVNLPANLPWIKASDSTNPVTDGTHTQFLDGQGKLYRHSGASSVTHTSSFISYYFADFTDFSGNNSINGGTTGPLDMKIAIFNADGKLAFDLADVKLPKYAGTDNTAKGTYNKSLIGGINNAPVWGNNDAQFAIKTAGSVEVEANRDKGIAIKTAADTWKFAPNALTGNMDGFAEFGSETAVTTAIQYYAANSLVGFSVEGNDLYSIKFSPDEINYPGRPWDTLEDVYSKACAQAKRILDAKKEGLFTATCPSA